METNTDNNAFLNGGSQTPPFDDLLSLLNASTLPEQNFDVNQPFQKDHFKGHVLRLEENLTQATSMLVAIDKSVSIPKNVIIHTVLLCGEHSKSENWSSTQTIICAEHLLKQISMQCSCSSLLNLFLKFTIESFLFELRPKLLKSSWKNHPAAVSCFMWILFNLKCPHLGDVLSSVLPTCLLLVDDHSYSNKVMGLQCLQHVASNVSYADLNQYGRGTVIYNAIEHMIYLREPEIIPALATCLFALLQKTEHKATTNILLWSHFDDVLNIWLPSMELEQRLVLREAYIDSLNGMLQVMGLASVRWSNKLLRIFSEYCEQDHTRNKSLISLQTFIKTSWTRISSNFNSIIIILMKVIINIVKKNTESEFTVQLVRQCFKSLENFSATKYNTFLNELKNNTDMNHYYILLTDHQSS